MPKTVSAHNKRYRSRARATRHVPSFIAGNHSTAVSEVRIVQQETNIRETQRLWRMRWFFAIIIAIWILLAMVVTVLVFWLTKNPYSLSLFSTLAPPVYFLHRFAKYLLPKDVRDYQLAALKIRQLAKSN